MKSLTPVLTSLACTWLLAACVHSSSTEATLPVNEANEPRGASATPSATEGSIASDANARTRQSPTASFREVEGELADTDAPLADGELDDVGGEADGDDGGSVYDDYAIEVLAGWTIRVTTMSHEFRTHLVLLGPSGARVAAVAGNALGTGDDPDTSSSEVRWLTTEPGTYRVRVVGRATPHYPRAYVVTLEARPGTAHGAHDGEAGDRGTRTPLAVTEAFAPLTAAASQCGAFDHLGTLAPQLALGGRLSMQLPAGASSSARSHDVMAAPAGDEAETRFVLDRGGSRLVVFLRETFAAPGATFAATAARLAAENIESGALVHLRLASGLEAAVAEPTSVGGPPGGIVVADAWIVTPEGTVVNVAIFVTPDVAAAPIGCAALARTLLEGIAPGAVHLDVAGGRRTLGNLTIDLPPMHVVVHDEGPDFSVYRIHPIGALGEPGAELGLYVGGYPSFEPEGTEVRGRLLGRPTSWWIVDGEDVARRQALGALGAYESLHAFVTAPTSAAADALMRLASEVRPRR